MNYGFDLDDTITALPEEFRVMMSSLVHCGEKVHVITGVIKGDGSYETQQKKLTKLRFHKGHEYTHLHVIEATKAKEFAEQKRAYCEANKIDLMFEDRSDYARAISKVTPCVLVGCW